jgi:hypothetical protein
MEKLRKVLEYKVKNEAYVESLIIRRNNYTVLVFLFLLQLIHYNLNLKQIQSMESAKYGRKIHASKIWNNESP